MKAIITRFNNLSLYKKIRLIISLTIACICVVFFFSIQILSRKYETELYQTNAQTLNHVSSAIESGMQTIETVSNSLISDPMIQDNLVYMAQNPYSNRLALVRRNIYQALYPYTFYDNYIKSINLILPDQTNLCMGSDTDILRFDTKVTEVLITEADGRLIWVPGTNPGSDVACARQIRQIKYLTLEKLASLYITVDMERMIQDSLKSAGYIPESSNFILMADGKRIYPENAYHDDLCSALVGPIKHQQNSYNIVTLDGKKQFIIEGEVPYAGWDYLYFRDYDPIFHQVQSAKVLMVALTFCFALLSLLLVQLVFRRILRHLDFLVEKIQCFGSGAPAPVDKRSYNYQVRQDEIGQLHRSFDEMTKSVKVLRDENYDKQLLLRDATIRMLQQQINPHFLYNTLDTINWMAQKYGADDICVMVRSLGSLFRASITGQSDFVYLADELSFLDNYIQIQKIRFKERLNFEMQLPDDITHIQVPKLCIQPLVENALKHAMEYTDETCTIRVTIQEKGDDFQIQVANTGSQFEDDLLWKIENRQITPQGSGVGLVNINSRLKLLYGGRYGLHFYNKDAMAIVMLSIPKERENDYASTDDSR